MPTRTAACLCALALFVLPLGAAEYFVSLDGSDASDGLSRAAAFGTIQRGVDALEPGDTLTILPGEYFGGVRREGLGGPDAVTAIRADIPGTVTLRGDVPAPEFRRAEGYRFVYVADFDYHGEAHTVNELGTMRVLEGFPSVNQLEFVPGQFHHDRGAGKLYISTPDLANPQQRRYTVSVTGSHGIYLARARRVVIEGLAVTGFNTKRRIPRQDGTGAAVWGIFLHNSKDCVVRDCLAYMNGNGIAVSSNTEDSGDNAIERCKAWANDSRFGDSDRGGLTIHGLRRGARDVIRDSVSFLHKRYGVNVYSTAGPQAMEEEDRYRMVGNLAWGNFCDFKIKTGFPNPHTSEHNIGPGLWSLNDPEHCLMGRFTRDYSRDNIALNGEEGLDLDAEFADPANHDYRLQATSRFRGTGPGGADRGPLPYEENVYYVSPDGDDGSDGLSAGAAWGTLERALRGLAPGDTLYLLPGEHEAGFEWSAPAGEGGPVTVRGRGHGLVDVRGELGIGGGSGVVVERIAFSHTVRVASGRDVEFKNCAFGAEGGLAADSVEGLLVAHCLFNKAPLRADNASGIFLSGNVFAQGDRVAVTLDAGSRVRYADYNSYEHAPAVWTVDGRDVSFDELRREHARYSQLAGPKVEAEGAALRLANAPAFAARGPHGTSAGLHSFTEEAEEPLRLAGPFVHSVTDTTANLEWWASAPTRCHLSWGEGGELGSQRTVDAHRAGSFSLTGLRPNTRYSFRVELDRPAVRLSSEGAEGETVEGATVSFATAAEPTQPSVYHVAPDGDDANTGLSRAQAWRTVAAAADRARPGDTVLVAGGAYHEAVRVRATGERGRAITFKAAPGEKVVFNGLDRTLAYAFFAQNKSHLHFDGFYFTGLVQSCDHLPWSDWARGSTGAVVLYRANDARVTRCFSDGRGPGYPPGLIMAEHSRDVLVRNSVTVAAMGAGISFAGCPGFRMENNVLLRNLISNVGECMNEPHQRFYMASNIFTDNLASKVHASLFSVGRIEAMVEADNCYHLRVPDEEKRMFMFYNEFAYERAARAYRLETDRSNPPIFDELTRMSLAEYQSRFNPLSGSLAVDPEFAGATDMRGTTAGGGRMLSFDYLVGKADLDFPDLFAENTELVKRGIGLQPEAFADFHFNVAE